MNLLTGSGIIGGLGCIPSSPLVGSTYQCEYSRYSRLGLGELSELYATKPALSRCKGHHSRRQVRVGSMGLSFMVERYGTPGPVKRGL